MGVGGFHCLRSEGASREGPGGGGTMFTVCLVRMVCFIWSLGLVRVGLWRWWWLGCGDGGGWGGKGYGAG